MFQTAHCSSLVCTNIVRSSMASLNNYIDSLAPDAKKRYKEEIALVDDIDPYATNKKT